MESVSTLRSIFINLKNRGEEQNKEIDRLGVELNKTKEAIKNSTVADTTGHSVTSRSGPGLIPEGIHHRHLPPSGGAKKLYSEAVRRSTDKRFKILVNSKSNLTTEAIKTVVKSNKPYGNEGRSQVLQVT